MDETKDQIRYFTLSLRVSRKSRQSLFRFFCAGLVLVVLLCCGCVKNEPLSGGGGGDDSVILTEANHGTGWGNLDCFSSTDCHREKNFGYDPEHCETDTLVCSSTSCHGYNGVDTGALIWGTVYYRGGERQSGITVVARNQSSPAQTLGSLETDTEGEFSIITSTTGLYDFEVTDGSPDTIKSGDSGMPSLAIDYPGGAGVLRMSW